MAGLEIFGNIIIKQEIDIPFYDAIEIDDNFLCIKEEITEPGKVVRNSGRTSARRVRYPTDKKVFSKCSVQLHQGEFDKIQNCLLCLRNNSKKLVCKICLKPFRLNIALRQHLIKEHDEFPGKCSICNTKVIKRTYKRHVATAHLGFVKYHCNLCPVTHTYVNRIRNHIQQAHNYFYWHPHYTEFDTNEALEKGIYKQCENDEIKVRKEIYFRAYVCQLCHDFFKTKIDLNKHCNLHTDCMIDYRTFKTSDDFKKHVLDHKVNECCVCSEKFSSKKELRSHRNAHINECYTCKLKFEDKKIKNFHIKMVHQTKICCDICGKVYVCRSYFEEHLQSHTNRTTFICEVCGKIYPSLNSLLNHKRVAHDKKVQLYSNPTNLYECELCQEKFTTRSLRKQHQINVHNGKRVKCGMCDKTFTYRIDLDCHINKHNGIKPFKCDICYKAYPQKLSLKFHMKKHFKNESKIEKNDSPYCSVCNKFIPHKNAMGKHLTKHEEKKVPCPVCKIVCDDQVYLEDHIKEIHKNKKYSCNICSKIFTSKQNLEGHKNKHNFVRPYKCTKCDRSFAYFTSVRTHLRYTHNENLFYKCEFCDLQFQEYHSMRFHIRTDHAEKNEDDRVCLDDLRKIFECDICKKKYVLKHSLQKHLFSVHFQE